MAKLEVRVTGDKQKLWAQRDMLKMSRFYWMPGKKCYARKGVDRPLARILIQRFDGKDGLKAEVR